MAWIVGSDVSFVRRPASTLIEAWWVYMVVCRARVTGAVIFSDGAPLGTFCIFSRRTLKELGWTAHHTAMLRGLAEAASTEVKATQASEDSSLSPTWTFPPLPR